MAKASAIDELEGIRRDITPLSDSTSSLPGAVPSNSSSEADVALKDAIGEIDERDEGSPISTLEAPGVALTSKNDGSAQGPQTPSTATAHLPELPSTDSPASLTHVTNATDPIVGESSQEVAQGGPSDSVEDAPEAPPTVVEEARPTVRSFHVKFRNRFGLMKSQHLVFAPDSAVLLSADAPKNATENKTQSVAIRWQQAYGDIHSINIFDRKRGLNGSWEGGVVIQLSEADFPQYFYVGSQTELDLLRPLCATIDSAARTQRLNLDMARLEAEVELRGVEKTTGVRQPRPGHLDIDEDDADRHTKWLTQPDGTWKRNPHYTPEAEAGPGWQSSESEESGSDGSDSDGSIERATQLAERFASGVSASAQPILCKFCDDGRDFVDEFTLRNHQKFLHADELKNEEKSGPKKKIKKKKKKKKKAVQGPDRGSEDAQPQPTRKVPEKPLAPTLSQADRDFWHAMLEEREDHEESRKEIDRQDKLASQKKWQTAAEKTEGGDDRDVSPPAEQCKVSECTFYGTRAHDGYCSVHHRERNKAKMKADMDALMTTLVNEGDPDAPDPTKPSVVPKPLPKGARARPVRARPVRKKQLP